MNYEHIKYYYDKVKWFNFVRFNYKEGIHDERITVANTGLYEFLENMKHEDDYAVAMISLVTTKTGDKKHIPLLDLSIPVSPENAHYVKCIFEKAKIHGFLLDSGKSYHFYGKDLLYEEQWLKFMYESLLIPNVNDTRHVAHRLLDGYGSLRLTANRVKPKIPELVIEW